MRVSPIKYTHEEYNPYINRLIKKTFYTPSINSILSELGLAIYTTGKSQLPACLPLNTQPGINNAKNPDNKGLVLILHGLYGDPTLGKILYKKELEKQGGKDFEIWIPNIPKKGNCSLEEASDPILKMVKKYIETNPGKPIQIIGHSNGGRIAAYLETHLRDQDVDIRITGIAGVFFGSDLIYLPNLTGISRLALCKAIRKDLQTGSKKSKELITAMREPVKIGSRTYTFYTTIDDIAIPNFTSCLPNIGQKEECVVLTGCGHTSILEKVCKKEIEKTLLFLKNHPVIYQSTLTPLEEPLHFHSEDNMNLATISA